MIEQAEDSPAQRLEAEMERREVAQPVDYYTYRAFCDIGNDAFRCMGLLNEESYDLAVKDKRTILCNILGRTFPALVPVEYESRYDSERTKQMTGVDQVMLLTIPAQEVGEATFDFTKIIESYDERGDFAILVEQLHGESEAENQHYRQELAKQFYMLGKTDKDGKSLLAAHEFINPDIDSTENKTAWMGIYDFSFESTRNVDEAMLELSPTDAISKAWQDYKQEHNLPDKPTADSNETYLFTARQLLENPDIVKDLWSISEVGFGDVLGKHHPISMQVTKSFFEEHVTSDEVLTGVRFVNGRAVCFGFLAPNMNYNDWLDCESTTMKNNLEKAEENGEQVAHFFELISKGEAGIALSPSILKMFLDVASRSRQKWHLIFESTNLSDTYIPKIGSRTVERSSNVEMTQPVNKLAQLDYWYLK